MGQGENEGRSEEEMRGERQGSTLEEPELGRQSSAPEPAIRHIAIIMDGNGRWAEERGLPRIEGHREGAKAVRKVVRRARELGIPSLTLFAFSEQNWERPSSEVAGLMTLLEEFLRTEEDELRKNRIQLRAIGRVHRLPPLIQKRFDELEMAEGETPEMVLTLALSYGGKEEIFDTTHALLEMARAGALKPRSFTIEDFERVLPSMRNGPVDLMIRTGNEQRISNFMLWGAAYAELYFSPKRWPDFTELDLDEAIRQYRRRERRFGRIAPEPTT